MAIPKILGGQTDFSGGEFDPDIKRDDELIKIGGRQCANWRILSSKKLTNRPGRTVRFFDSANRIEEVQVAGLLFYLCFEPNGTLIIRDATGAISATSGVLGWAGGSINPIVWCVVPRDATNTDVVITYLGMRPQIARYTIGSGWSFLAFAYSQLGDLSFNAPFYRLAPAGMTLQPDASLTFVTTSSAYFTPAMANVGHVIRYFGRQFTLTNYSSPTKMFTSAIQNLPLCESCTVGSVNGQFFIGDIVIGSVSGFKGEVGAVVGGGPITGLVITHEFTGQAFATTDIFVGPNGTAHNTTGGTVANNPVPSVQWDEAAMDNFSGWPASCFNDQNRLGFCNLPAVPSAIVWSAIADYSNFFVGALSSNAIFELAPGKSQVLFVIPGPESSEIIFCDNKIYYIPITVTNPLTPSTVAFNILSGDGVSNVKPVAVEETIFYAMAGGRRIKAVISTGAYLRPFNTIDVSQDYSHLFSAIIAIAAPTSDGTFPERHCYALNSNGALAVGRFHLKGGQVEGRVGWLPWSGAAAVTWVSALNADTLMTSNYAPNITAPVAEVVDATQYLDVAFPVNNPPIFFQQAQPAGTPIGNMTGNGGLAAAFNGTRIQNRAASANLAANDGYVGKQFTVAQVVGQALIWPSTDHGFADGNFGPVVLELRAKQTAPASATDGTLIGSLSLASNFAVGPVAIVSTYSMTAWAYAWVHISEASASNVTIAQLLLQTGPMWWESGAVVSLMDQSTRSMGTYFIDVNGNLIPQFTGGEDLQSSQLVVGQPWTSIFEPFVPDANPGNSQHQRMFKRRVSRMAVYVMNSTGFLMARLFSGPVGPNQPALGTIVNQRRVTTYNQDDDPTQAPFQREEAQRWRPLGRYFDPRVAIIKDTPGPLLIAEIGLEASI